MLRQIGVKTVLGGEFEEPLTALAAELASAAASEPQLLPVISLARQALPAARPCGPARFGLLCVATLARRHFTRRRVH